MSEHDIADCPKCEKRDYVLKEDGVWVCLNCGHTAKMPRSKFDPEPNPNFLSIIVAAFIVVMVMMVAMGV